MSVVGATHTIVQGVGFAAELHPCSLVEISGPEMIPPSDDAIMIRFMFYKETMHTFAETWTHGQVEEYLMIPESPTKAITVRPSEFYHQDAASIVKSPSGRMMIDFIDTHFPPEDKQVLVPKLVATIIDLVQSSNPSESKAFVDVRRRDSIQIMHCFNGGEGVTYREKENERENTWSESHRTPTPVTGRRTPVTGIFPTVGLRSPEFPM
ncbi:hypothetical protein ACLB2K_000259 [Fragaria x ananassa]